MGATSVAIALPLSFIQHVKGYYMDHRLSTTWAELRTAVARPAIYAVLACGAYAAGAQAAGDAWPQYGYDAGRTFHNPQETTLHPGNAKKLRLLWSRSIAKDYTTESLRSVAYRDGQVAACADSGLYVRDARTGGLLQRDRSFPTGGCQSLVLTDSKLLAASSLYNDFTFEIKGFVTSRNLDGSAQWTSLDFGRTLNPLGFYQGGVFVTDSFAVTSFDAATGEQRWSAPIGNATRSFAIGGGKLVAPQWQFQQTSDRLVALDASSGAVVWEYTSPTFRPQTSMPIVTGGKVLMVSGEGTLGALNLQNGKPLWKTLLPYVMWVHHKAADSSSVYLGAYNQLTAHDLDTGATKWHADLPGSLISNLAVANGVLYAVVEGADDEFLIAVDTATGAVLKEARDTGHFWGGWHSVIVADGMVLTAGARGYMNAFGLRTAPARSIVHR